MKSDTILIIGAGGQIGTELTEKLYSIYGTKAVFATDIRPLKGFEGETSILDVMDREQVFDFCQSNNITQIYHLAAVLSAKGEQNPRWAWDLNMNSLFNVLEAASKFDIKVFWPSSIAVFGPTTPKNPTPQQTICEPTTVYGISKLSGEQWCAYYKEKYNVDVRSLRFPGVLSYKSQPGGGTTDYAVDIFYSAAKEEKYSCFLNKDQKLPMMYMTDAVNAIIQLMDADLSKTTFKSYNIAAFSFTPEEIAEEIQKFNSDFTIEYNPDFRAEIADSWPDVIEDKIANQDWNWKHQISFDEMVKIMFEGVKSKIV